MELINQEDPLALTAIQLSLEATGPVLFLLTETQIKVTVFMVEKAPEVRFGPILNDLTFRMVGGKVGLFVG